MAKMTWLERRYRRSRLDYVRHITIDPRGPGVVRIHMIPPRTEDPADPFLLLLNGAQLVPLNLSWAILLANFMDQLEPWSGREIGEQDWQSMLSAAVKATRRTYPGTGKAVLLGDLELMLRSIVAIARGQEPPAEVGALSLGEYAGRMSAPHRMDLMISAMTREGRWHCNQKCLHCYAAGQTLGETPELTTDQWRELLEKLRRANIPQVTFTGGEPTLRPDLPELVEAAQWFVTRLNTNGRLLTPELCRRLSEASLDSVQVTLYDARREVHNALVGAEGFDDTVQGIRNAAAAGLIVSVNTPLCSLNRDYAETLRFVHGLGGAVRHLFGADPHRLRRRGGEPGHPAEPGGADGHPPPGGGNGPRPGHGAGLHQPRLAAGGGPPGHGPAPDPQLRGVPVQHGPGPGRHGAALPELAGGAGPGEPADRRLERYLGRRAMPPHPGGKRQNGAYLPAAAGRGLLTMRKILCRALLCLCLVLALGPVHTAFAQDLDRIESYDVDVTPNTEDGSLRIQVTLEWTVLAEGPVSWVKIGVPNGSIRQEQALTDNIDRLSFDNSYMYVYFNRDYDDGETFRFSYSWIQEYMYTLGADGSVEYVYTPGWFNEARVGQMTLTWHDPAGVDGVDSLGNTGGDHAAVLTDLDHGQQLDFTVRYDSWPAQLAQEGSRDNLPQDNDPGYDPDYQDDGGLGLVGLVILLVVVFLIVRVAAASDGYRGGFGTHYVFVSGLWYPAGPDGRPRPGSHGTREKPKPPRSGGFGGGSRGGGFGGGGFGGGGHCACASSCACACACACAGGGRAGCSAKNLYGAVHLDQELTREMEK